MGAKEKTGGKEKGEEKEIDKGTGWTLLEDETISQPLTFHNEGLFETGKKMLGDSLSIGTEFCKTMMSTSSGAVAIYLGFFAYLLPKDYRIVWPDSLLIITPPFGFLVSALIFAVGYYPQVSKFSLDDPEQIDNVRTMTITRRARYAWWGMGLFLLSTAAAILIVLWVAVAYRTVR